MNNDSRFTIHELRIYWRAVRPFSFPASIVPALLGTAIAWSQGFKINFIAAIAAAVGAVVVHAGANLINDYWDYKKGIDRAGTLGGSGLLVEGVLTPKAALTGSLVLFAVGLAIAIPYCFSIGWNFVWLIVAGFIAGAGYVLPPFSLKYRAFGDLTVFTAFGVGVTLGSYVMQTHTFSLAPVLYSIPIGMLIAAILHVNNMRDIRDDIGFKTIAGLAGLKGARLIYAFYVLGAYAVIVLLVALKEISFGSLLCVVTIPLAIGLVKKVWKAPYSPKDYLVMMDAKTAQLNLAFGVTMIIGIIVFNLFVIPA